MTKQTKMKKQTRNKVERFAAPAIIESYNGVAYGGADLGLLMEILKSARPHGSKAEKRFARDYLDVIPGMESDSFGNRFLKIAGDGDSVIWASHIDTVHRKGGTQKIRKRADLITLAADSKSRCLGADDGAGVWLMLQMITEGKPGVYIFHRAEECGGLGSDFIASYSANITADASAIISLDRFGFDSVVTHQGGRSCSDTFAQSLADGLGLDNLKPDDTGLFTDSANYVDVIGECTNLSVGYFGHHTTAESLDVGFICLLRSKLLALDSSALVIERAAGDSQWADDDDSDFRYNDNDSWIAEIDSQFHDMVQGDKSAADSEYFYTGDSEHVKMTKLLTKYPHVIADLIRDYGIDLDEICEEVFNKTGEFPDEFN